MSRLTRVKLKIERAKEHVRDLDSAMESFRSSNPYGFRIENDAQTGDKLHYLNIRVETPNSFALMIGDAVHNLRTSLDHLAWQLVEANGNTPKIGVGGTQFPIYDSPSKLKTGGVAEIQGITSDAQKLVNSIKPYKGGCDDLWILHELDLMDKHRLLFATAFALSSVGPTWRVIGKQLYIRGEITSFRGDASSRLNVDSGLHAEPGLQKYELFPPIGVDPDGRMPMLDDGKLIGKMLHPIQDEAYFYLAFEIALRQPQIVEGKPIVPLLKQLCDLVDGIVNQFSPFL
jgi:hypothetical protein